MCGMGLPVMLPGNGMAIVSAAKDAVSALRPRPLIRGDGTKASHPPPRERDVPPSQPITRAEHAQS